MALGNAPERRIAGKRLAPRGVGRHSIRMTDAIAHEERLAHLIRAVDDLSDTVARQETEIALLTARVAILMEREAGREAGDGAVLVGDERPPHW